MRNSDLHIAHAPEHGKNWIRRFRGNDSEAHTSCAKKPRLSSKSGKQIDRESATAPTPMLSFAPYKGPIQPPSFLSNALFHY